MNSKSGKGYITPCLIMLCIFMLLAAVISFAGAVQMTRLSQKSAKICLDSFVAENAREIFDSVKNGDNILDALDTDSYTARLIAFSSLERHGDLLYNKDDNGKAIFWISTPELDYTVSGKLMIYASYTAYIPLYFCGIQVDTAAIPLRVESKYINIFQ